MPRAVTLTPEAVVELMSLPPYIVQGRMLGYLLYGDSKRYVVPMPSKSRKPTRNVRERSRQVISAVASMRGAVTIGKYGAAL